MPNPAKYVQPVHFPNFSGAQFERLVFAYHARVEKWRSLEWYGQTGADLGRDIWGIRENGEQVCIQCANRKSLTFAKIRDDISKILRLDHGVPQHFRVVAGCDISAKTRDAIRKHAKSLGILNCDLWSGAEFEEFLRRDTTEIFQRFTQGKEFPDDSAQLSMLEQQFKKMTDQEILAQYARLFDRAAFYTPISMESNLQDFKQAITDTIQALGTGIRKSSDGHLIERLPSRHDLKSEALRKQLQSIEVALARLRGKFDEMLREGVVEHCKCNDPKCTVYMMPRQAADELETLRSKALVLFRDLYPSFRPGSWQGSDQD
jgi:hypothetical protein